MRALLTRSVTAALSLLLGAGVLSARGAMVKLAAPIPPLESAAFHGSGPLGVSFAQLSANAVAQIQTQSSGIIAGDFHDIASHATSPSIRFSGSQPGALLTAWEKMNVDPASISASALDEEAPSAFFVTQAPVVNEVGSSSTAWQSLPAILLLILLTLLRTTKSARPMASN